MDSPELRQSWLQTEAHLRDARNALPCAITEEHATALTQFEEFLDHNELGLAADWLADIATESPSEATTSIEALILAERSMGRTSNQRQLEVLLAKVRANNG